MKPRPTELDAATSAGRHSASDEWRTALTCIEPNKILVRGYPLDEIMGRLTFGEAIYLLLVGEIPTPGMGRLMEALYRAGDRSGASRIADAYLTANPTGPHARLARTLVGR